MTIWVALRLQQANLPRLVNADKAVRHCGCAHGVDRGAEAAVGAVLEADRHGEARRHFAVRLRLGRARANR